MLSGEKKSQNNYKLKCQTNMNYAQAFPKLYRKLKENNITYNSLTLIQKLKQLQELKGQITDKHIETIVKQLTNML